MKILKYFEIKEAQSKYSGGKENNQDYFKVCEACKELIKNLLWSTNENQI